MSLRYPCVSLLVLATAAFGQETRQATGVKVGEVSPTSAIVWVRLTANSHRNTGGIVLQSPEGKNLPAGMKVSSLEGACPGTAGRVRVRYGAKQDLRDAKATEWVEVTAKTDYSHQFRLTGLEPATLYHFSAETAGPGGSPKHGSLRGSFQTAPPPEADAAVKFTVITGQHYRDMDHPDGYNIYPAMARLAPRFIVETGDNVYYDGDAPHATTIEIARHHWDRMYSFPRHIAFHLSVPGYWEKDDHDTLSDDCWPAMLSKMLPMTFKDGQRVFLQQVPMGDKTYRTYRWGKAVQIWLPEGRDFRSPNNADDGPQKTIWGAEQKSWLKASLLASDATWRVLVSPTPIVGPDRGKKGDNHSNAAFAYEGNEFRQWVKQHVAHNFFVVSGDRHWQYHSVHPETGVQEFACGPTSDEHASGSPGYDPNYHRFHRVKGGFLSVSVNRTGNLNTIAFRLHDVHGAVVYEYVQKNPSR